MNEYTNEQVQFVILNVQKVKCLSLLIHLLSLRGMLSGPGFKTVVWMLNTGRNDSHSGQPQATVGRRWKG